MQAGNKSELSGKQGILNAHHFKGKGTYALRYDLRNGICLLNNEHLFKVHSKSYEVAKEYYKKLLTLLKQREGNDIEELLNLQKYNLNTDLKLIKIYLEQKLKEMQNE